MRVGLGREQSWILAKNLRGYSKSGDSEPLALGHERNRGGGLNGRNFGDAAGMSATRKARG